MGGRLGVPRDQAGLGGGGGRRKKTEEEEERAQGELVQGLSAGGAPAG